MGKRQKQKWKNSQVLAQRDKNLSVRRGGEEKKAEEELDRQPGQKTPWSKMHGKERKEDEPGTESASAQGGMALVRGVWHLLPGWGQLYGRTTLELIASKALGAQKSAKDQGKRR